MIEDMSRMEAFMPRTLRSLKAADAAQGVVRPGYRRDTGPGFVPDIPWILMAPKTLAQMHGQTVREMVTGVSDSGPRAQDTFNPADPPSREDFAKSFAPLTMSQLGQTAGAARKTDNRPPSKSAMPEPGDDPFPFVRAMMSPENYQKLVSGTCPQSVAPLPEELGYDLAVNTDE